MSKQQIKVKASAFASNTMVVGSGDPQSQLLRFQISAQSYHQLNFLVRARPGKFEMYWYWDFQIAGITGITNSAIIEQY